jgi:hypothetical protein
MVTAQQAQVLTNVAQVLLSLASVIFAGALTYVTYRYYTETRQQTVESRRNREAEFKPVLKATLVFQPVNYYHFAIVNTGKGAAHDVQAEWQVDDYSQSTWAIPHFASKDQFRFAVQLERNGEAQGNQGTLRSAQEFRNELADKDGILYYKATCEDALGNSHEFEEEIPLIETIDGRVKVWNDRLVAAHFRAADERDAKRAAGADVGIAHCPLYAYQAPDDSGTWMPVPALTEHNATISLGLDDVYSAIATTSSTQHERPASWPIRSTVPSSSPRSTCCGC